VQMRGIDYRKSLDRAVRYYRNGRTFQQIKGILGGNADLWHLILELKGEVPTDELGAGTVQEARVMLDGGMTQRQIAERLSVSQSSLSRALSGKNGLKAASWANARIAAREAARDYKEGLTLEEIRWKFGYRTNRVALAAIERISKELEG